MRQRVKSTPPLSTFNCFEALANISDSEMTSFFFFFVLFYCPWRLCLIIDITVCKCS